MRLADIEFSPSIGKAMVPHNTIDTLTLKAVDGRLFDNVDRRSARARMRGEN